MNNPTPSSKCRCPDNCSVDWLNHLCICQTHPRECRYEDWDPAGACGLPLVIPPHSCSCHIDPKQCRLRSNFSYYENSIKPEDIPPHQKPK